MNINDLIGKTVKSVDCQIYNYGTENLANGIDITFTDGTELSVWDCGDDQNEVSIDVTPPKKSKE